MSAASRKGRENASRSIRQRLARRIVERRDLIKRLTVVEDLNIVGLLSTLGDDLLHGGLGGGKGRGGKGREGRDGEESGLHGETSVGLLCKTSVVVPKRESLELEERERGEWSW